MPSNPSVLWVTRDDAVAIEDALLRERAGLGGTAAKVHTKTLGRSGVEPVPAGSRDEWGTILSTVLNVGYGELPPQGRVYVVSGP
ncbi:hypothetical protein GCM10009616_40590 [Microlunatus lacustris]